MNLLHNNHTQRPYREVEPTSPPNTNSLTHRELSMRFAQQCFLSVFANIIYALDEGRDDAQAVRWLRKAADQGHTAARSKLDEMSASPGGAED